MSVIETLAKVDPTNLAFMGILRLNTLAFASLALNLRKETYLIFVISFTQAGFSKTKFYTQKND